MILKRHQDSWKIRPDNSTLVADAQDLDIRNIYAFCENFHRQLAQFVSQCNQIPKTMKLQQTAIIVDTQENLSIIIQIVSQQRFIFLDIISETRNSYKGYISYIIIGTNTRMYLVDAAKLHDHCFAFKQVLQKKSIIKYMYDCQDVLYCLKRDWRIFMPNIFDLEIVNRFLINKGKSNLQPKSVLRQFLMTNSSLINVRPIPQTLLTQIEQYYESSISLLINLDKFFTSEDPEYQSYVYVNHFDFLLKSYCHHSPSVKEIDELQRLKKSINSFAQNGKYIQIQLSKEAKTSQFWVKEQEDQQIAEIFCEWRQHLAKMNDIHPEQILSFELLSILAKKKPTSILQVSQICSSFAHSNSQKIYTLHVEHFQQIFELLQLHKEMKEEQIHELVIPRRFPSYKPNDQKPIKLLLEDIKFSDTTNDWLNKKNDQSIRLYKQILSIAEFDSSIIDEYLNQMKKNQKGLSLKMEDINIFIKYAEYLRMGNHKRLQQLHEMSKNTNEHISSAERQLFNDNFIQDQQYSNWDEIEEQINFPKINAVKSFQSKYHLTSYKAITNKGVQSCNILGSTQPANTVKQKRLNSLCFIEAPPIANKIEPLPQNIQDIYFEAAKAKTKYLAKGQKKISKACKKQSQVEPSSKKQEEFIPKKEEIFNLIYY